MNAAFYDGTIHYQCGKMKTRIHARDAAILLREVPDKLERANSGEPVTVDEAVNLINEGAQIRVRFLGRDVHLGGF